MKKIAVALIAIVFCLSLVACDPAFNYFDRTGVGEAEVASVQLIDYDASDITELQWWKQYIFPSLWWHPLSFDENKCTVIETLNEDKKEDFINNLKDSGGYLFYYKYNSPKGMCLKITYSDGNFLIIGLDLWGYVGEYAADGSCGQYYGASNLYPAGLINDYFEYQFPIEEAPEEDQSNNEE